MTTSNKLVAGVLAVLLATVALAGCTSTPNQNTNNTGNTGNNQQATIPEVVFTATDYKFTGPDTIPAGLTKVTMRNNGMEWHEIQFFQLPANQTAANFTAAMHNGSGHPPMWALHFGGPGATNNTEATSAYVNFTPGTYVLTCPIPSPVHRGAPHTSLGMMKFLNVTNATASQTLQPPAANVTVSLRDFSFNNTNNITAGNHTIRVTNDGQEPHELIIVELQPGATAEQVLAAFAPGATAPPPAKPVGGISAIEPGMTQHVVFTAKSGVSYAFFCFVPSESHGGAPHFALGMMKTITVA